MEAGNAYLAYWARVWAKAALENRKEEKDPSLKNDPSFKTKLETDHLLAYRQVKEIVEFGSLPTPLIDDMTKYEGDTGVEFSTMTLTRLDAIINGDEKVPIAYNALKKA
jgi:hypothetical protein